MPAAVNPEPNEQVTTHPAGPDPGAPARSLPHAPDGILVAMLAAPRPLTVALSTAALLALSACGGAGTTEETGSATAETESPAPTEPAETPDSEQTEDDDGEHESAPPEAPAGEEDQTGTEDGLGPSFDPESIHVLVNRNHPLDDWEPTDLVVPDVPANREGIQMRQEAAAALEELFDAALAEHPQLALTSGYRSFDYQVEVYSAAHRQQGTEGADEYHARPGYSEHQSGLAADLLSWAQPDCVLSRCFADTAEGQWLAQNAHEFGFIIRYPDGQEDITGFPYEPWHLRYLGRELAGEVHASGLTLEEFWDQPPVEDYPDEEPLSEQLDYTP